MMLPLLPLLFSPALLQEEPQVVVPEGHSIHGEAFDEGPRQAAYLMAEPAAVHFPITTSEPLAQKMFDQGVGQLHGFWYFEAERSFRQVAALEPDCALAYWGMAMANTENQQRAGSFAHEAWLRREEGTPRERLYAESIAHRYAVDRDELEEGEDFESTGETRSRFLADMEAIVAAYPDDLEAKALLVNQYWLDESDHSVSKEDRDELLLAVLTAKPDHPAHHYRIHLWDEQDTIEKALGNAGKIGPSWPSVAHQWHMAGHVYDRLERYVDAAWQQEASARVDHAHMQRDLVLPDRIHNFAHNNEWLMRSLSKAGRGRYAAALAKNMVELPRHPRWNGPELMSSSTHYGPERLLATLEEYELWDEVLALADTRHFGPDSAEGDRLRLAYLLGKVAVLREDDEGFDEALMQIDEIQAESEGGATPEAAELAMARLLSLHDVVTEVDVEASLEVLAELELDRPTLARIHALTGDHERALELAREDVAEHPNHALPLATLTFLLEQAGRHDEALAKFEELRAITPGCDLDVPAFQRLAPLAQAAGLPEDWRLPYDGPAEKVARVDLDDLGPALWSPPAAPHWRATDPEGLAWSTEDMRGKPRILVLFLGLGCVHCVEQLQAFGPRTADFENLGVELVAIGDDPAEALAEANVFEAYPFPVLADTEYATFHAFRSYDDFEDAPLHGTFLIDAQDRIRWMDVGAEPFTDMDFLLAETERLLSFGGREAELTSSPASTQVGATSAGSDAGH